VDGGKPNRDETRRDERQPREIFPHTNRSPSGKAHKHAHIHDTMTQQLLRARLRKEEGTLHVHFPRNFLSPPPLPLPLLYPLFHSVSRHLSLRAQDNPHLTKSNTRRDMCGRSHPSHSAIKKKKRKKKKEKPPDHG